MLLISWVTLLLWFYYGTKLSCFVDECVNRLSCTKKIEKECRGLVCLVKIETFMRFMGSWFFCLGQLDVGKVSDFIPDEDSSSLQCHPVDDVVGRVHVWCAVCVEPS